MSRSNELIDIKNIGEEDLFGIAKNSLFNKMKVNYSNRCTFTGQD